MERIRLKHLVFWALCCTMGMFSKRLIAPVANIFTDFLHIPGGIGTSFSLMFLIVAAQLVPYRRSCTIMSIVQSGLALGLGMVGSMGALSPIGYIMPGIAMDVVLRMAAKLKASGETAFVAANTAGAICAALTANLIVFRLSGLPLLLYLCISAISGAAFGVLGSALVKRLKTIMTLQENDQRYIGRGTEKPI